jgi:K+-sensing histidine kinase KdpD
VSIVSHDLRTPLTSIRGYAQLLQRQLPVDSPASLRLSLDMIVQQSDRLAEQTEWLLEVARVQTNRIALRRTAVDLEHVAREVLAESHAVGGPSRGADEARIVVDADLRRVRQMIHAMFEFASSRPAGAVPRLQIDVVDGYGRLAFEDEGEALASDERAQLFEQLVRVSDDGAHRSLAHFGLVIAAGAAAAHGGRLEVESPLSESERGARLTLLLPLSGAAA